MDILIVSDTHEDWEALELLMKRSPARTVLFLGDGLRDLVAIPSDREVVAVCGNCDFYRPADVPETRVEIFEGYRVFMTHGHRFGAKHGIEDMVRAAMERDADVLVHGHTHQPYIAYRRAGDRVGDVVLKKDMIMLCPGSLGQPPRGERASFATLTVRKEGVLPSLGEL